MGAEVLIRSVRPGDAEQLAPLMRPEDVSECAAVGRGPLDALQMSLAVSEHAWAVEIEGEIAALFGVEPLVSRQTFLGAPALTLVWALTGRAVNRHPLAFARASRGVLAQLLDRYPYLWNMVDARYTAALRWVRWLGAEVWPAVPVNFVTRDGPPFHPVHFRRDPWVQR